VKVSFLLSFYIGEYRIINPLWRILLFEKGELGLGDEQFLGFGD